MPICGACNYPLFPAESGSLGIESGDFAGWCKPKTQTVTINTWPAVSSTSFDSDYSALYKIKMDAFQKRRNADDRFLINGFYGQQQESDLTATWFGERRYQKSFGAPIAKYHIKKNSTCDQIIFSDLETKTFYEKIGSKYYIYFVMYHRYNWLSPDTFKKAKPTISNNWGVVFYGKSEITSYWHAVTITNELTIDVLNTMNTGINATPQLALASGGSVTIAPCDDVENYPSLPTSGGYAVYPFYLNTYSISDFENFCNSSDPYWDDWTAWTAILTGDEGDPADSVLDTVDYGTEYGSGTSNRKYEQRPVTPGHEGVNNYDIEESRVRISMSFGRIADNNEQRVGKIKIAIYMTKYAAGEDVDHGWINVAEYEKHCKHLPHGTADVYFDKPEGVYKKTWGPGPADLTITPR